MTPGQIVTKLLSMKTMNICAKLQLHFHQSGFRDQGLSEEHISGTLIFLLVGLLKYGQMICPPFWSQLANQDVSDVQLPRGIWGGHGNLHFTCPLFKMEVLSRMASIWFLLILESLFPNTQLPLAFPFQ